MEEKLIGEVSHYWGKIEVAGIEITDGDIQIGDELVFRGAHTEFSQKVESMQIDGNNIEEAQKGDSIGMKIVQKVREKDKVYKIIQ